MLLRSSFCGIVAISKHGSSIATVARAPLRGLERLFADAPAGDSTAAVRAARDAR